MSEEDLVSRCGETTLTALTFKLSKCYKFIEDLLENKLSNDKFIEEFKKQIDECFDYINDVQEESASVIVSQSFRINCLQDSVDRMLERIGKLEKSFQKIIEQHKGFDERLTKLFFMCGVKDFEPVKSSACPECDGKGEILNNNIRFFPYGYNELVVLRKDSMGNTYETCKLCKGSGVIIK